MFVVVALCPKGHRDRLRQALGTYTEHQLISFCHFVLSTIKTDRAKGTPDSGVFASLGDLIRTRPHPDIAPVGLASKLSAGAFSHCPNDNGVWSKEHRYRSKDPKFVTVKCELMMLLQDGEFAFSHYKVDESVGRRLRKFLCPSFYWNHILPIALRVEAYVTFHSMPHRPSILSSSHRRGPTITSACARG